MKLSEIREDKGQFVGKLKDPVAQELQDLTVSLNKTAGRGWSFNAYNADKELATIIGRPPGMDVELQETNMIEYIKSIVNSTHGWKYKAWKGDVEEEFAVYVVRRT